MGKKFVALHELFINPEWFMQPKPVDFSVNDPSRFNDDETRFLGHVAELWQLVPPAYQPMLLESPTFASVVSPPLLSSV